MENDYAKLKENMEAFVALYETVLKTGILDNDKKLLVEAVLFFAKETLKHARNAENAEKHDRPKEEIDNIYKKCGYCMLAVTAINNSL